MENDNIYKPKSLPQLSAPFSYVAHELNDMGQPYELVGAPVDAVNPSQAFIDSDIVSSLVDKLKNGDELKAIWLDKDNNTLDGHHRHVAYSMNKNSHIPSVRMQCDRDTGIKILKEIQAKYDRENNSDFLNALKEDGDDRMYVRDKDIETRKETVKAFRKNPIIEKSPSGNFFSLKEIEGYKPYEIEFESLIDSDQIDPKIKKEKNPPLALALAWFPNINIEKKAADMEMSVEEFICSFVAEKARTKGIDGILYGDKLLQTIDEK